MAVCVMDASFILMNHSYSDFHRSSIQNAVYHLVIDTRRSMYRMVEFLQLQDFLLIAAVGEALCVPGRGRSFLWPTRTSVHRSMPKYVESSITVCTSK